MFLTWCQAYWAAVNENNNKPGVGSKARILMAEVFNGIL